MRSYWVSEKLVSVETGDKTARGQTTGQNGVCFARTNKSWKVDLEYAEDPKYSLNKSSQKPGDQWRSLSAPYATPEDVYAAFVMAMARGDAETAWLCLTERRRNDFMAASLLMLVEGGGGDSIMAWYLDMEGVRRDREQPDLPQDATHSSSLSEYDEQVQRGKRFAAQLYDTRAYFAAVVRRMNDNNQSLRSKGRQRESEPLQEVRIGGQRARGIVKKYFWINIGEFAREGDQVKDKPIKEELESFEEPYYFAKQDVGWLIDIPTAEEQKKDEESQRSND